MRRLIPSKKVIEEFHIIYELKGVQRAINFLTRHYRIRRMKIVVDGRRVGKGCDANYDDETYTAFFSKRTLNKENALHELFHHISNVNDWSISERNEEKRPNDYSRKVLKP